MIKKDFFRPVHSKLEWEVQSSPVPPAAPGTTSLTINVPLIYEFL